MERHPDLQFVFTEQGTAWIPETLGTLDYFFHRMGTAVGSQELEWGGRWSPQLSLRPERVLGPPVPRRLQLHAPGRGGAAPCGRGGQDHVGQRLPPQGVELSRSAGRPCGSTFAGVDPVRGAGDAGRQRGAALPVRPGAAGRGGGPGRAHPCRNRRAAAGGRRDPGRGRAAARPSLGPAIRQLQPGASRMGNVRYGATDPSSSCATARRRPTSVDVWATTLVATYLTDPEVVAAVLPPPIEPGDEPLVKVADGHRRHPRRPTFGAGSFSVRARHEGTDGYYALLMPMTTEQSVIGGRETFGEPKKLGTVVLGPRRRPGDGRHGPHGGDHRRGRRPGRPSRSSRPARRPGPTSTSSSFPSPDGKGFDTDPALVYCHRTEQTRDLERVDGRGDPPASPVSTRWPTCRCASCARSPWPTAAASSGARSTAPCPAEWLRPYVHQRYDDLSPAGD